MSHFNLRISKPYFAVVIVLATVMIITGCGPAPFVYQEAPEETVPLADEKLELEVPGEAMPATAAFVQEQLGTGSAISGTTNAFVYTLDAIQNPDQSGAMEVSLSQWTEFASPAGFQQNKDRLDDPIEAAMVLYPVGDNRWTLTYGDGSYDPVFAPTSQQATGSYDLYQPYPSIDITCTETFPISAGWTISETLEALSSCMPLTQLPDDFCSEPECKSNLGQWVSCTIHCPCKRGTVCCGQIGSTCVNKCGWPICN